ncbi:hypothetical protein B0H14DRAFT_3503935 [Mycena olivaceomarginata]|nr:hypothetical protein B0H14DRAFT_3503935 [Mycena olivaceomarginata]
MTLHGLRAFAEHCKALKFLAIIIDGFTVPLLDDSPQTRIPQRQLCSFDVVKSPISDARLSKVRTLTILLSTPLFLPTLHMSAEL